MNATHFLGAVVIHAHEAQSKKLTTWSVIDGQQRLTTLQLLADAACALLAETGQTKLSGRLERLTHNADDFIEDGENPLKLRHLNKDRDAFNEVMSAEPPSIMRI